MRKVKLWAAASLLYSAAMAQPSFPVNGVADKRDGTYAFTHATIVKEAGSSLANATLLIKEGSIVAVGPNIAIPAGAIVIDCSGKFIYPSFIDIYTDYGQQATKPGNHGWGNQQMESDQKGAYGWNQAIHTDVNAYELFAVDDAKAEQLRLSGFGTVLTHKKDGIAQGTGTVVTLASLKENLVMVKERASAHYSFNKGSSAQSYPNSLMGSIALLRQTYLDGQWYKTQPKNEGTNLSLQYWNDEQALPQIFEANDRWNSLRADRIGDEFGVQYIIKAGNDGYQRIKQMVASKAAFILPLNFPQAQDLEDPADARYVSLASMKHWEMAPANPSFYEQNKITFCLTTADLKDPKQFWPNLRKALEYGLSDTMALNALTKTPAKLLGVYDKVGSIDAGKLANFIITSGPIFAEKTSILYNWVSGEKYAVNENDWKSVSGNYNLFISSPNINPPVGTIEYFLYVKNAKEATVTFFSPVPNKPNTYTTDTVPAQFDFDGKMVSISFSPVAKKKELPADTTKAKDSTKTQKEGGKSVANIRLSGISNGTIWQGTGVDTSGNLLTFTATFTKAAVEKTDSAKKKTPPVLPALTYPLGNYGFKEQPKPETILIKNATIWTSDAQGKLENSDLLIKNGKIAAIGKNLSEAGAKVMDAKGKHVSPGIIDEHSHIAAASINEGGQSVTAEVRIGDNMEPDDVDIYRQLSGGVTTSHILHGSANTIGGQTQLIKLRWGLDDEQIKFAGWDGFIKFALGENVKRTYFQSNNRFPDTRMGVEQVMADAFQRATDYQKALQGPGAKLVRRDLELDALVEIMNKKRFITCHSYVQSEITGLIRMGEKYGFKVNTFTHILEGYKVADKMKAAGASASTFSDWWAYKMEVQDAIPYNAYIMQQMGLNVCINSDDGEMARRLNQEAAKSVKYGGMSEEEALKMVTINPAKALHIDKQTGSLKVGKDADLVIWSDNPLSIYAIAQTTIVDGIVYFDRARDLELRKEIQADRNRLTQKMIAEKKGGGSMSKPQPAFRKLNNCGDHEHRHGLLDEDSNF